MIRPTITAQDGTGFVTTPLMLLGYETERRSGNIVHQLVGGGTAVTLFPAPLRSGRIEVLYGDLLGAHTCLNLLSRPTTFRLVNDPSVSRQDMLFAIDDNSVTLRQDPATGIRYIVGFGYQELS
jgi:hypothetical protein